MLDKPWAAGVNSNSQSFYQPVVDCTYWPVLGPLNNWNIVNFTIKTISSEEFDEVHHVLLDLISDNMDYLL